METKRTMEELENHQNAFSRAYHVLGLVYLRGPIPELLPSIQAVPELAAVLQGTNPDELAADHYQIFGLEIHPYESTFLGTERMVGGEVTEKVFAAFLQEGFSLKVLNEASDHLGWELLFLSHLCNREAEAAARDDSFGAIRLRNGQRQFLEEHLLRWLPALLQAVRNQQNHFYTKITEFALALSSAHYEEVASLAVDPPRPFVLPEPPALLSEERTGLRDIAAYLLTPAYAGAYFSRLDIQRLAKEQNIPRGFGDRQHMLTSLLRNAAEYDQLPLLLSHIRSYVGDWGRGFESLENGPYGSDAMKPFVLPWIERSAQARGVLGEFERITAKSMGADTE